MNLILQAEFFTLPYISFLVGLVFCFLGRKLLGLIVILFGFIIGYTWGAGLLADLIGSTLSEFPWIPFAAGAAGAVLGLLAWKVSLFFAGTVIGLFIVRGLFPALPGLAHVGIALASGVLVQLYRDPVIALLTAIAGGYIAAGSAVIMLDMIGFLKTVGVYTESSNTGSFIAVALTVIFAITGYKFQTRDIST